MVTTGTWGDREVFKVENEELAFWLCPSLGNNLYRLWDKVAKREVLRVPAAPSALIEKPGHWGTPLMLPPNRIRNGKFAFEGREYALEINTPNGHHIHGFLRQRPWKVVDSGSSGGRAHIRSTFRTRDFPELASQYPNNLCVEVHYEVEGRTLNQIVTIRNEGGAPAPVGFGLHTWFMIDGEPARWKLKLPVEDIWGLDDDLMPSGAFLPLGKFAGLGEGLPLAGSDFDTVFRIGPHSGDSWLIRDDGYTVRYTPTSDYKHWVIYTMGVAKDVICLEPYTWVTNAPNLSLEPSVTGFRAVPGGEEWQMGVRLEISG